MTYTIRAAQRSEAKPLIGLYAQSGTGKTYSALLIARGFSGPAGKIGMIETEAGRGEAYSNPEEYPEFARDGSQSNYDVISLRDQFSPVSFGAALSEFEKAKFDAVIIDSASLEWSGAGGVLGMAAKNQEDGKKGVLVWQQPKQLHKRHFMLPITQTPIPLLILCMRAKYPMQERPKQGGGKEWVRSEQLEPEQADDILYELFVHGWIDHDHKFHLTKSTVKALAPVFADGKQITLDTGRRLREWTMAAAAPKVASPAPQPASQPEAAPAQRVEPKPESQQKPTFIIHKGSSDETCATIEIYKSRFVDGLPKLTDVQADRLLDMNVAKLAEYEKKYPVEIAVIREAFKAKTGRLE